MIDIKEALESLNKMEPKELINWLIDNKQFASVEIQGNDVRVKLNILKRGKKNG